jgi:hypothetical protein
MRKWRGIGIGVVALLLAAGFGAAACTSPGDDGGDDLSTVRQAEQDTSDPQIDVEDGAGGAGGAFGICIEGTVDCVDTPLNPEDADCAPDAPTCGNDAIELGFSCDPGLTVEECLPDGVPAGHECVTLESYPIQVRCYPIECAPSAAPTGNPPAEEYAEDLAARCDAQPDKCASESAGDVRCLPPDCAVSSDGSVSCPGSEPCDAEAGGCSVPAAPPAACPDQPALTEEECARSSEGGGTDGSAGIETDPAPGASE